MIQYSLLFLHFKGSLFLQIRRCLRPRLGQRQDVPGRGSQDPEVRLRRPRGHRRRLLQQTLGLIVRSEFHKAEDVFGHDPWCLVIKLFLFIGAHVQPAGLLRQLLRPHPQQEGLPGERLHGRQGCNSKDIWDLGPGLETTSRTTSALRHYKFRHVSKLPT